MPGILPSNQATGIPSGRTAGDFLKGAISARQLNVEPPRLVEGNNQTKIAFDEQSCIERRLLQNCGTTAVKVAINTDASATVFHWVLAACSAQDDGLGSVLDLSAYQGSVSVFSAGAYRIATFRAFGPEKGVQN